MICRTFIFFFLCYFSNHVLIQVQPNKYTSILRKGFNVKQMIDYSVDKFLFLIFFNIFRLLFCNLLTILFDDRSTCCKEYCLSRCRWTFYELWVICSLLKASCDFVSCTFTPHLLSFYIWIHAHVLNTDVYFGNIESLFSTKQFHNHWHLCINRLCVFLVAALRLIVLEFPHLFP